MNIISFEKAQALVRKNSYPKGAEIKKAQNALGYVLARDIKASVSLPLYDNAAMDGFAFHSKDTANADSAGPLFLRIKGTIKAGDTRKTSVKQGEAWRIMTGAPIPSGVDTVLPREAAHAAKGRLVIDKPILRRHIHREGEEIKAGDVVIKEKTVVRPAVVGLLAAIGLRQVKVFKRPRVSLISTGSELVDPGKKLSFGKIYDTNLPMLCASLAEMGIKPCFVGKVPDKLFLLRKAVSRALEKSDVVVVAGGVSVGEYDFAKEAFRRLGVSEIFWNVSQKPGKPLYFGKRGKTLVFGLPGNPAAVFTSFYEYVFPALRRMMGFKKDTLSTGVAVLGTGIKADRKRTLFLKARTDCEGRKKSVIPLKYQGSHMISSLCEADSFIVIPPGDRLFKKGRKIGVHYLPYTDLCESKRALCDDPSTSSGSW